MNIEQLAAEHAQTFTVAKIADLEFLEAIQALVNQAMQQHLSLDEFRARVSALLARPID